LINFKRAPNQAPKSVLYKKIMETVEDSKITIAGVDGDTITVNLSAPSGAFTGNCSRMPANGLNTFDFANNGGVLSHIHLGHEVKQLSLGRPRRNSIG
jgi:hypothetical protein